jgi:formylglycine-generating enzyme required for sulfatase activity
MKNKMTGITMVAIVSVFALLSSVAPASSQRRSLTPEELAARGFVAIPAGTFTMGSPVGEGGMTMSVPSTRLP